MKEYKGYYYNIEQDYFCEEPNEYDNLFLVFSHKQFMVGVNSFEPIDIYTNPEDYQDYFIFPVFAYIHSGVSLSLTNKTYPFNDKWDVSMNGFVLVSKDLTEYEEEAMSYAENLIISWNQYLLGDIHRLLIYEKNVCSHCLHENFKEIDNFGEIYGMDEAETIAEETINDIIQNKLFNNE